MTRVGARRAVPPSYNKWLSARRSLPLACGDRSYCSLSFSTNSLAKKMQAFSKACEPRPLS